MIRNYIIIAIRNVLKSKVFSAINVLGLSIGLAACLLIIQFVSFEMSYDNFHKKLDRTYRITNDRFQNGRLIQHGTIMYPTIGATMAKDFPEVEEYTRLMPGGTMNVRSMTKISGTIIVILLMNDSFLSSALNYWRVSRGKF